MGAPAVERKLTDAGVGEGFPDRLRLALKGESVHAFAARAKIGDSTMRKYLSGSEPGLDKVIRIARAARVRLEWLATGSGPMHELCAPATLVATQVGAVTVATDARLISRLTERILVVHKEMGVALAIHQAVERAVREHDRIVSTMPDPEDRLIQIGEVVAELRHELRSKLANPAASKHRA